VFSAGAAIRDLTPQFAASQGGLALRALLQSRGSGSEVEAFPRERPLLHLVQLSSQRTLEPVRHDGCFAEKQGPGPALLLPHRPTQQ
jgi:hypothetical protein